MAGSAKSSTKKAPVKKASVKKKGSVKKKASVKKKGSVKETATKTATKKKPAENSWTKDGPAKPATPKKKSVKAAKKKVSTKAESAKTSSKKASSAAVTKPASVRKETPINSEGDAEGFGDDSDFSFGEEDAGGGVDLQQGGAVEQVPDVATSAAAAAPLEGELDEDKSDDAGGFGSDLEDGEFSASDEEMDGGSSAGSAGESEPEPEPEPEENAPDNAEGTSTLLDKLDADGDGVVSFDEFTENVDYVTTEGEEKKDEDEKEEDKKEEEAAPAELTLLDKLDADGDGIVSFDEFTENVAETTGGGGPLSEDGSAVGTVKGESKNEEVRTALYKLVYKTVDRNGDGLVSKEELAVHLESNTEMVQMLQEAGFETAAFVLEQIDADGDGMVSVEEFTTALTVGDATEGTDEGGGGGRDEKEDDSGSRTTTVSLVAPFGIGLDDTDDAAGIRVGTVKAGKPASKSGKVRVGMLILSVNGNSAKGMRKDEVSQLIKDCKGAGEVPVTFEESKEAAEAADLEILKANIAALFVILKGKTAGKTLPSKQLARKLAKPGKALAKMLKSVGIKAADPVFNELSGGEDEKATISKAAFQKSLLAALKKKTAKKNSTKATRKKGGESGNIVTEQPKGEGNTKKTKTKKKKEQKVPCKTQKCEFLNVTGGLYCERHTCGKPTCVKMKPSKQELCSQCSLEADVLLKEPPGKAGFCGRAMAIKSATFYTPEAFKKRLAESAAPVRSAANVLAKSEAKFTKLSNLFAVHMNVEKKVNKDVVMSMLESACHASGVAVSPAASKKESRGIQKKESTKKDKKKAASKKGMDGGEEDDAPGVVDASDAGTRDTLVRALQVAGIKPAVALQALKRMKRDDAGNILYAEFQLKLINATNGIIAEYDDTTKVDLAPLQKKEQQNKIAKAAKKKRPKVLRSDGDDQKVLAANLKEILKDEGSSGFTLALAKKAAVAEVRVFLNLEPTAETTHTKQAFENAVSWLIDAMDVAANDVEPFNKAADILIRTLLKCRQFTRSLNVHGQFGPMRDGRQETPTPLRDGATAIMSQIGERLSSLFAEHELDSQLSAEVVEAYQIINADHPWFGQKDAKRRLSVKGKSKGAPAAPKAQQRWAVKGLFDLMKRELDFDKPVAMAERAALIAMLTYSRLQEEHFKRAVKRIATKCGLGLHRGFGAKQTKGKGKASVAAVKGYSRSFNKIYSKDDYLNLTSDGGRAAYIMDPLRCLFAAPDVKTFKSILQEVVSEMGGVLQIKNPFGDPPAAAAGTKKQTKREEFLKERSNLLIMNLSVVFDSKKKISDLAKGPEAEAIFKKVRENTAHTEPGERWETLVDQAIAILKHGDMKKVPAKIGCEVQITFDVISDAKDATHLPYEIVRAVNDVQLHNQFAGTGLSEEERAPANTFHAACFYGQLKHAKTFLEGMSKSDIKALVDLKVEKHTGTKYDNGKFKGPKSPLFVAALNNHVDIVDMLIRSYKATTDDLVADLAVELGFPDITGQIKLNGKQAVRAIFLAAEQGRVAFVKESLESGAMEGRSNETKNGQTMLCIAAGLENPAGVDMTNLLLEKKAKVNKNNKDGQTALAIAVEKGNVEVAEALIKHGANPNEIVEATGKSLLFIAAEAGNKEMVSLLAKNRAQFMKSMQNPHELWVASQKGYTGVVGVILTFCQDASNKHLIDRSCNGKSSLQIARIGNTEAHFECAELLLSAGALEPFATRCWVCVAGTAAGCCECCVGCCESCCESFDWSCCWRHWYEEDFWCEEDSNMCFRTDCRDYFDDNIGGWYSTYCCCCGNTCGFGGTAVGGVTTVSIVAALIAIGICLTCICED